MAHKRQMTANTRTCWQTGGLRYRTSVVAKQILGSNRELQGLNKIE
jgi:hypothetical protein